MGLITWTARAEEARKKIVIATAVKAAGTHWLGILADPIDDALRSQLDLDERLIVVQVVPDGPAAKAGVKKHDILLSFGDVEIRSLDDLVKAVGANSDKESKLVVLRGGKKHDMQITPAKRPENVTVTNLGMDPGQIEETVRKAMRAYGSAAQFQPDGSLKFSFFGPGLLDATAGKYPGDLSISVTKSGDSPAKIAVQQGDKKWEVTEESLDTLPENVRPHVERLLGRHKLAGVLENLQLPDAKQLRSHLELRRMESDKASRTGGAAKDTLEELRKGLESLREEVKKLREGARKNEG
jgi:membrane-associated protease RseP (regulator of RpoE activity)